MEVVREPFTVGSRSHRRLEERLAVRFPGVVAGFLRLIWALPLRSRLRQAALRRVVRTGFEATNRGDHASAFATYNDHVEMVVDPRFVDIGFESVVRGHAERIRFQERWNEEWGAVEYVLHELVAFEDGRFLVLGRIAGSGLLSGAGVDSEWADLFEVVNGRVVREQFFFDHADALSAAGLPA